jgi:hypothetical protein
MHLIERNILRNLIKCNRQLQSATVGGLCSDELQIIKGKTLWFTNLLCASLYTAQLSIEAVSHMVSQQARDEELRACKRRQLIEAQLRSAVSNADDIQEREHTSFQAKASDNGHDRTSNDKAPYQPSLPTNSTISMEAVSMDSTVSLDATLSFDESGGATHRNPGSASTSASVPPVAHRKAKKKSKKMVAYASAAGMPTVCRTTRSIVHQGSSQVLHLSTRFPNEVLSLSTKPEVPCCTYVWY